MANYNTIQRLPFINPAPIKLILSKTVHEISLYNTEIKIEVVRKTVSSDFDLR